MPPIDALSPSGFGSSDGLAYDLKTKVAEVIAAVNDLNDTLTTESAATLTAAVDALEASVDTAETGLLDRVTAIEALDVLEAQADVADLGQDISAEYVEAEVQAISDKVDAILAALRSAGVLTVA